MEHDENISKLLRLKRYEQPPPEYFENFLAEFQLRQRADVIHRPFWKIAWDRLTPHFTMPSIPRLVTAGSFALAFIALVLNWSFPKNSTSSQQPNLASVSTIVPSTDSPAKVSSSVQYVLPARPVTYASARSF
jgi:hypothetical protein